MVDDANKPFAFSKIKFYKNNFNINWKNMFF